jgi:hypothetical protein
MEFQVVALLMGRDCRGPMIYFEKTEANFLANVRRGRFKALTKKLPEVLNDSRKLWRHLWRCKEFMKYRQR